MTSLRDPGGGALPPRFMAPSDHAPPTSTQTRIAGWLLIVVGCLDIVHALTLLDSPDLLNDAYVYDDVRACGWTFLALGAAHIAAGIGVLAARRWAIVSALIVASLSIVMWFLMVFAAPVATIVAIAINCVILAGLSSAEAES